MIIKFIGRLASVPKGIFIVLRHYRGILIVMFSTATAKQRFVLKSHRVEDREVLLR